MRALLFLVTSPFFLFSCRPSADTGGTGESKDSIFAESYLLCQYSPLEEPYFVNEKGDVIINIGEYVMSYSDTIRDLGMVMDSTGQIWAINKNEEVLFEVYNFDNGPDYVEEGVFRIVKNGLIGYANEKGEIVIEPKYECAYPFEEGSAKVSLECESKIEFEMTAWDSSNWIYIDHDGQQVKPGSLHPVPGE